MNTIIKSHGRTGHQREDGAAYEFGDLWNYGVSELLSSVHPVGKPIIHSTKRGSGLTPRIGLPISRVVKQSFRHFPSVGFVKPRLFLGVGNNPDPISWMGGTNGARRNAIPFSIIPERGQRSENVSEPVSKQLCDVFHDDEIGSKLAHNSSHLEPKAAPFAVKAGACAIGRNILAGKASADDIDGYSIPEQPACCNGANIVINRNSGKVFSQRLAGFAINLAERDGLEAASALKPERKAADAAKKIEDTKHHLPPLHPPPDQTAERELQSEDEEGDLGEGHLALAPVKPQGDIEMSRVPDFRPRRHQLSDSGGYRLDGGNINEIPISNCQQFSDDFLSQFATANDAQSAVSSGQMGDDPTALACVIVGIEIAPAIDRERLLNPTADLADGWTSLSIRRQALEKIQMPVDHAAALPVSRARAEGVASRLRSAVSIAVSDLRLAPIGSELRALNFQRLNVVGWTPASKQMRLMGTLSAFARASRSAMIVCWSINARY